MVLECGSRQRLIDGYGPIYHRVYTVTLDSDSATAKAVMSALKKDMNQFSPQILARFEKVSGPADELQVSDEFLIHITGPWNGPVRVSDVYDHGFHLVTLEGHLEAGEISFQIVQKNSDNTVFKIESWARSRDQVVDFVYDKIPVAKAVQTEMWTYFCKTFAEKVSELAHGSKSERLNEVEIMTERQNEETGQWEKI